jgi:thioredoxin 1
MAFSRVYAAFGVFLILAAVPAMAQPIAPFSAASLRAAQASGKPILVDVFADWCPTCRAQHPTIESLSRDPAFARLVILRLDYDRQTAEERALGVRMQSTLIAFKGAKETARSVGVTDPDEIRATAATAMR